MPIVLPQQHMTMEKFVESIDADNDGRISRTELQEALRGRGVKFAKLRAWMAMRKLDRNRNRHIDPGETADFVEYAKAHWNIVIVDDDV